MDGTTDATEITANRKNFLKLKGREERLKSLHNHKEKRIYFTDNNIL